MVMHHRDTRGVYAQLDLFRNMHDIDVQTSYPGGTSEQIL